jgi:biotin operon repressor
MRFEQLMTAVFFLGVAARPATAQQPQSETQDWAAVESAIGRKGQAQPDGVFKVGMPRSDMQVTVGDTKVKAGLALGSWAGFKRMGQEAVAMGDLVLTESEVEPVMMKLKQEGFDITALHNHLLGEQPRVMYMHFFGHGDAARLAKSLHDALALTKTPAANPAGARAAAEPAFEAAQVARTLGHSGKMNNGIYQVSVARAEKIMDHGMEIPPSLGVATAINFQPTDSGRAAITGDFVLVAEEVNNVIRELRGHGIEVTALHSHMLTDQPHLFFMHFWANDNAVKLAEGLRTALDKTNSAK